MGLPHRPVCLHTQSQLMMIFWRLGNLRETYLRKTVAGTEPQLVGAGLLYRWSLSLYLLTGCEQAALRSPQYLLHHGGLSSLTVPSQGFIPAMSKVTRMSQFLFLLLQLKTKQHQKPTMREKVDLAHNSRHSPSWWINQGRGKTDVADHIASIHKKPKAMNPCFCPASFLRLYSPTVGVSSSPAKEWPRPQWVGLPAQLTQSRQSSRTYPEVHFPGDFRVSC